MKIKMSISQLLFSCYNLNKGKAHLHKLTHRRKNQWKVSQMNSLILQSLVIYTLMFTLMIIFFNVVKQYFMDEQFYWLFYKPLINILLIKKNLNKFSSIKHIKLKLSWYECVSDNQMIWDHYICLKHSFS